MDLWRTLAGKKPYLLLMNTDFDRFGSALVERYFQRSLFYGMYPSMFSHNAADNPYWKNPAWYNRDRFLFQRYQPLIKEIAEAGWQPVTRATSDNPNIFVERFGPRPDGTIYFTLYNGSATSQDTRLHVTFDPPATEFRCIATEMLSGIRLPESVTGWPIQLEPQTAAAIKVQSVPRFLEVTVLTHEAVQLVLDAPVGTVLVLEHSINLVQWLALGTNTVEVRPFPWLDVSATNQLQRFYRIRR
jgi:hypothetical protein